jgi:hypothetical protein
MSQDKIKQFFMNMNEKGIPVPLFRDPEKNRSSITFTLFLLSGLISLSSFVFDFAMYILFATGKISSKIDPLPKGELLMAVGTFGGFYFGRKTFGQETTNAQKDS